MLKSSVDSISVGKTPPSKSDTRPLGVLRVLYFPEHSTKCSATIVSLLVWILGWPVSPVRAQTLPDWLLASRVPRRQALHEDWMEWGGGGISDMPWGVKLPRRLGPSQERNGGEQEGGGRGTDGHQASSAPWLASSLSVPRAPSSYVLNSVLCFPGI